MTWETVDNAAMSHWSYTVLTTTQLVWPAGALLVQTTESERCCSAAVAAQLTSVGALVFFLSWTLWQHSFTEWGVSLLSLTHHSHGATASSFFSFNAERNTTIHTNIHNDNGFLLCPMDFYMELVTMNINGDHMRSVQLNSIFSYQSNVPTSNTTTFIFAQHSIEYTKCLGIKTKQSFKKIYHNLIRSIYMSFPGFLCQQFNTPPVNSYFFFFLFLFFKTANEARALAGLM